ESTRANLVKAEEKVNDYTLKAPWNGVISTVHVRQGDYVIPRTPLVEIYNPSSIVVSFNVPEQYCMQINKNLNISILLDAYPNRVFEAKITRIYPQLDKKTHMRIVEAQIVANVKLIPQMFSRVNIVLKAFKDAVVLSSTSILKDKSNKPYVFKIKEDKAYKQYVKLGFGLDDGRVLILDGINKGEQIVTAGFQGLKDKTAVLVVLEKSKNNELK
ncbi:MAG: RND family efflux transporter MFP subunit, partial [Sulfurimonas sp.]